MQAQICIEVSFAGSTVVFAVDMKPPHDGLREGWSLPRFETHRERCDANDATDTAEWLGPRPGRDVSLRCEFH